MANPDNKTNKRSRILLLLILLMLVGITSCIVGYILGQRSAPQQGGEMIDNIIISPTNPVPAETLSLSGIVRYTDGTPAAHTTVELHSTPRMTVTDENGYFFFHLTETGEHELFIVSGKGEVLASCPVEVTADDSASSVNIQWDEETGYTVEIPVNVLLVEVEVVLGDGETPAMELGTVAAIQTDGAILTPDGTTRPEENRTLATKQGNTVFDDGTVLLPDGRVLLNDGALVETDGAVTHPSGEEEKSNDVIWTENDAAILPGGTVLTPGGHVITNKNDIIHPDGYIILEDGTVVDSAEGSVTLSDGTVITTENGETTLPDGTVIDQKENTVTLPGGTVIDQEENTVTLPDGTVIDQTENTVTLPDGTVIDQGDNTVTLPDGTVIDQEEGTVTPPEETTEPEETTTPGTTTTPEDTTDTTDYGKVSVTSEGKSWTQNTIINLFAGIDKLYPGVEGSYTFKVSNTRREAIVFSMTVADDNTNAIPFILTLKDSKGNVVSADRVRLAANSSMTYTLYWEWPYESGNDAYDTMIGESNDLTHTVTITIRAEGQG